MKALLTAISSPTIAVQAQSLELTVRTVFHIYRVARNAVNKNTAKATLRQILNIVFQRMEIWTQRRAAASTATPAANVAALNDVELQRLVASPAVEGVVSAAIAAAGPVPVPDVAPSIADVAPSVDVAAVEESPAGVEEPGVVVEPVAVEDPAPPPPPSETIVRHPFGDLMYDTVALALGFGVEVEIGAPPPATPAKQAAPVRTPATAPAAPAAAAAAVKAVVPSPGAFPSSSLDAVDLGGFPSHFHRDAFVIFRALCRRSMKVID